MAPNIQWRKTSCSLRLPLTRPGWPGVWDAVVAAVTGRSRRGTPTPMTLSMYVLATPDSALGWAVEGLALEEAPFTGLTHLVTPEMMREAEAHLPHKAWDRGPYERWEWLARFLNEALTNPNRPCPCCGVTPAGDILDHLPTPGEEFRKTVLEARAVWIAEHPFEEGRDHVTPFDQFLYGELPNARH